MFVAGDVNVIGTGSGSIIRCRSMTTGFGALTVDNSNNMISHLKFIGENENVNGSSAVDVTGTSVTINNCVIEGFQVNIEGVHKG